MCKSASLLRQTLEKEKAIDKKLAQLSGRINIEPADSEESKGGNRPSKAKAARPWLPVLSNRSKGEIE
jgi:hypothetical protein